MSKVHFIVNPNASNGRCGKVWKRSIERRVRKRGFDLDVHLTARPGEASDIAEHLCSPESTLVSVGGDGTHNEVVTGIIRAKPTFQPVLGCLTLGTGGDFRKTLKLPEDPFVQMTSILEDIELNRSVSIDLGRLDYVASDGSAAERGFINIASFGVGGQIDQRVNQTTKLLGGFASFLIGSVRESLTYSNQPVSITLDDDKLGEFSVFNCAVANGRYFGGGMHIAPNAEPDDGLFDVVLMGDLSLVERITLTPLIYRGTHLDHKKVGVYRARKVVAESTETVLLDVDGEQPGRLPATFTIMPEAVRLLGASAISGD